MARIAGVDVAQPKRNQDKKSDRITSMKIRIRFRECGESQLWREFFSSDARREFLSSLNLYPDRWEEEQVADSLATPTAVIFGPPPSNLRFPLDAIEFSGAGTWDCHFESDRDCSRFCVNGRVVAAQVYRWASEADFTEKLSRLPEDLSGLGVGARAGGGPLFPTILNIISKFKQLKALTLSGIKCIADWNDLSKLTLLEGLVLHIYGSDQLTLNSIGTLTQLRSLVFVAIRSPVNFDLSPLSGLDQLAELRLSSLSLTDLLPLEPLRQLKSLELWCKSLVDLHPLARLRQLTSLNLSGCRSVTNLSGLSGLDRLDSLDLGRCSSLTDLTQLSGLGQLRSLNLSGCDSVTNLSGLSGLNRLDSLYLGECSSLTDLTQLSGLAQLRSLNLSGCELINDLTPLSSLSKLERLDLSDLRRLRSIEPLRELVSLREVKTAFHPSVVAELKAHLAALRSDTSFIDKSSGDWLREAIAFTDGQQFEQERFAATLGEAFSLLGEHEIVPPYQAFLDSRPDFSAMPWKAWLEGCAKNRGHDVMAREVERVPPEQLSPGGVGGRCAVLPGEDAPPDWQDWARDWLGRLEQAQSSRAQQLLPVSAELCLAHARLGLREALERWLKRFTDPSDTAALDPVQAALGEWQLRQGDTRAALAHALAVQQPGCRDPLLVRLVEAIHGDEAEQAGEILLRIESESLRRDLALKLVQLDSFAALPANMERLIVACGSSPAMLAELIRLAAPGADPSHLSALSNRLRSTTVDADR
jgi:hypothetical protein